MSFKLLIRHLIIKLNTVKHVSCLLIFVCHFDIYIFKILSAGGEHVCAW